MHSVENLYLYLTEDLDLDNTPQYISHLETWSYKILPTLHFVIFNV